VPVEPVLPVPGRPVRDAAERALEPPDDRPEDVPPVERPREEDMRVAIIRD